MAIESATPTSDSERIKSRLIGERTAMFALAIGLSASALAIHNAVESVTNRPGNTIPPELFDALNGDGTVLRVVNDGEFYPVEIGNPAVEHNTQDS